MAGIKDGLGYEELGQAGSQVAAVWITGSIVAQSDISGANIYGTGIVQGKYGVVTGSIVADLVKASTATGSINIANQLWNATGSLGVPSLLWSTTGSIATQNLVVSTGSIITGYVKPATATGSIDIGGQLWGATGSLGVPSLLWSTTGSIATKNLVVTTGSIVVDTVKSTTALGSIDVGNQLWNSVGSLGVPTLLWSTTGSIATKNLVVGTGSIVADMIKSSTALGSIDVGNQLWNTVGSLGVPTALWSTTGSISTKCFDVTGSIVAKNANIIGSVAADNLYAKNLVTTGSVTILTNKYAVAGGAGSPTTWNVLVQTGSVTLSAGSLAWALFGQAFTAVPRVTATYQDLALGSPADLMVVCGSRAGTGSVLLMGATASKQVDYIAIGV